MDIDLGKLSATALPVRGETRLSGADVRELGKEGVRFPEPFLIDATARREDGLVVVAGRIEGTLLLQCGRCLEDVRHPMDVEFESRFSEAQPAHHARERAAGKAVLLEDDDGFELSMEDLDISFLPSGALTIPVADIVREQALLEIPLRQLCRDDCAGLCARCGSNLNMADCGCPDASDAAVDARLLALAELKKKLEQRS